MTPSVFTDFEPGQNARDAMYIAVDELMRRGYNVGARGDCREEDGEKTYFVMINGWWYRFLFGYATEIDEFRPYAERRVVVNLIYDASVDPSRIVKTVIRLPPSNHGNDR